MNGLLPSLVQCILSQTGKWLYSLGVRWNQRRSDRTLCQIRPAGGTRGLAVYAFRVNRCHTCIIYTHCAVWASEAVNSLIKACQLRPGFYCQRGVNKCPANATLSMFNITKEFLKCEGLSQRPVIRCRGWTGGGKMEASTFPRATRTSHMLKNIQHTQSCRSDYG